MVAGQAVYAITFVFDQSSLSDTAHADISQVLVKEYGFVWQQGFVYFGGATIDAVTCVSATQTLASRYPWFKSSIRDVRMLRIEENNDLMPAIVKTPKAVMHKAITELEAGNGKKFAIAGDLMEELP